MLHASFEIKLALPIKLTSSLQRDLVTAVPTKWRVVDIKIHKLEPDIISLKLTLPAEDLHGSEAETQPLREFRDLVISLVAFCTMVPVDLRSKGTFDLPAENGNRKQVCLGPMNHQFPAQALTDISALILGLAIDSKYASPMHFLWQALGAEHPLYRFINLAIAIELLVRHDSPVAGVRHSKCSKCNHELTSCPWCCAAWNIPATLREKCLFLIVDDATRGKFISKRNSVFHGLMDHSHHEAEENLPELNSALLIIVRNYLGKQIGVAPIKGEDLGVVLNLPNVVTTVFYKPGIAK